MTYDEGCQAAEKTYVFVGCQANHKAHGIAGLALRSTAGPAHLEHHADMLAIGPHMLKVVVQAHAVLLVARIARLYLRQERDLVARSVAVVRRALLHLRQQSAAAASLRPSFSFMRKTLHSQLTCVDLFRSQQRHFC